MATLTQLQARSAPIIDTLLNEAVRRGAQRLVELSKKENVEIRITSGYRSYAEQQELYNQGRTAKSKAAGEKIVTNAKPGTSYHNHSLAIDFVLVNSGYDMGADFDEDGISDWIEVVSVAKLLGFEWGGDWKSFKDYPHFQMTFGLSTAELMGGAKPSPAQIRAALAKIEKAGDNVMEQLEIKVAEQGKALEALQLTVNDISRKLNLSGKETFYKGYITAIEHAKTAGVITSYEDKSKMELNIIQMLDNIGLTDPAVIAFLKAQRKEVK